MKIEKIDLADLNPLTHPAYTAVLYPVPGRKDPLARDVRETVDALLRRVNTCPEDEVEQTLAEIVEHTWWYALRPDEIARKTIQHYRLPRPGTPMTVSQAALVLAAVAEAGYPITGNGAPDYPHGRYRYPPISGAERKEVLWAAAEYWARVAALPLTYVSLGDCRGFLPRPVQYDQPGGMHPAQRAALTFGPWADRGDECNSHAFMRRHTRLLLLVRR
jgi:hypothetical protein